MFWLNGVYCIFYAYRRWMILGAAWCKCAIFVAICMFSLWANSMLTCFCTLFFMTPPPSPSHGSGGYQGEGGDLHGEAEAAVSALSHRGSADVRRAVDPWAPKADQHAGAPPGGTVGARQRGAAHAEPNHWGLPRWGCEPVITSQSPVLGFALTWWNCLTHPV